MAAKPMDATMTEQQRETWKTPAVKPLGTLRDVAGNGGDVEQGNGSRGANS